MLNHVQVQVPHIDTVPCSSLELNIGIALYSESFLNIDTVPCLDLFLSINWIQVYSSLLTLFQVPQY